MSFILSCRNRGVGKLNVQKNAKVGDIITTLNEKKGLPINTALKLFEVRVHTCVLLKLPTLPSTSTDTVLFPLRVGNQTNYD